MKKTGIVSRNISTAIAGLGHTDTLLLCDAGCPVPHDREVIDVSFVFNQLSLLQTIEAVLTEFIVEEVILPNELREFSPGQLEKIEVLLPKQKYSYFLFTTFIEKMNTVKLH